MCNLFSVNCVWFSIIGYPMSYIEFVGTIFYLLSVWLIAKRNMLTWPTGIISVILYMILFYQIRLFSDTLEQVYYLIVSIYGWITWNAVKGQPEEKGGFKFSNRKNTLLGISITLLITFILFFITSNIHILLPKLFPEKASFPFLDALTTIMSFTAMWLMARKRIESWVYWIIVDVIGIGLYYAKEVKFISLLYVILLGMAIYGLINWVRGLKLAPLNEKHLWQHYEGSR
jgi:nicotinamide mononucleotide transporter